MVNFLFFLFILELWVALVFTITHSWIGVLGSFIKPGLIVMIVVGIYLTVYGYH